MYTLVRFAEEFLGTNVRNAFNHALQRKSVVFEKFQHLY